MYGQHITPPPGLSTALPGFEELTELSDTRLNPLSTTIGFEDLTIYRIGGGGEYEDLHIQFQNL